ncbi:5-formyltetrahydrofolate cyclo-ligase [Clostridium chromiireducens]|uniref:5-formyltetrahydrofolate cyclo-ligase n=1 Tax=Clostridium chromiireducens TaxID=225345 RepID=A0A1V4J1U6_9CLOT|nr:5-formyltetrahydrofolate cyclo-ligase [Clostridium chromiireducens]MVX62750.1 5-formyltetrahydrofolate cyclo-ligase [Clostridium chromiireducens]OPJ66262.1 putative 5-formyltetrahydrofolate cyclo-ligase [Clostridium chromiireducens]RII32759.1 5-formyltetrahydrofolate cyclo-ligase [Clostridium chromiireducens]
MSISNDKKTLRKEILTKRKDIDNVEKEKMDKKILNKFYESKFYKDATNIFVYISYDSEIDTRLIINKALKDNKKIYVPRTEFETRIMDAVEIKSFDNLIKSNYGILEPSKNEPCINPNELDLIVVPGVAFDRNGGRMGYGAGFYDRYFKKITKDNIERIIKLALAYNFQVLDKVPMNEQDVPVDFIITEKEFIG